MKRMLAAVLVLASCVAGQDDALLPEVEIGFRNPTAPIGGTARFDAGRFAGDWHVVARFARDGAAAPANKVRYQDTEGGMILPSGQVVVLDGPGVLRPETGAPIVVMWVDEGFRTAVIGSADGAWGMVLDRAPRPSRDRLKAAKEILDWYGWDLTQLRET